MRLPRQKLYLGLNVFSGLTKEGFSIESIMEGLFESHIGLITSAPSGGSLLKRYDLLVPGDGGCCLILS